MLRDTVVASRDPGCRRRRHRRPASVRSASASALRPACSSGPRTATRSQALLGRDTPFLAASMFRLVTLSALGLLVAVAFGISAWPVMLGVAGAQLVMVGAGVRQGLRA